MTARRHGPRVTSCRFCKVPLVNKTGRGRPREVCVTPTCQTLAKETQRYIKSHGTTPTWCKKCCQVMGFYKLCWCQKARVRIQKRKEERARITDKIKSLYQQLTEL